MSSGTTDYIEALDPDYAIQTGTSKYLSDETKAALIDCGTEYYPADFQQLVGYDYVTVSFMPEGIEIDGASCPYSLV